MLITPDDVLIPNTSSDAVATFASTLAARLHGTDSEFLAPRPGLTSLSEKGAPHGLGFGGGRLAPVLRSWVRVTSAEAVTEMNAMHTIASRYQVRYHPLLPGLPTLDSLDPWLSAISTCVAPCRCPFETCDCWSLARPLQAPSSLARCWREKPPSY